MNRTFVVASIFAAGLLLAACGGPGRSASKAGSGYFDDRNALEPSPCACILLRQQPPDADFYKRLDAGQMPDAGAAAS